MKIRTIIGSAYKAVTAKVSTPKVVGKESTSNIPEGTKPKKIIGSSDEIGLFVKEAFRSYAHLGSFGNLLIHTADDVVTLFDSLILDLISAAEEIVTLYDELVIEVMSVIEDSSQISEYLSFSYDLGMFLDNISNTDNWIMDVGKTSSDTASTSEIMSLFVGSALGDSVSTQELLSKGFTKGTILDVVSSAEMFSYLKSLGASLTDVVISSETKSFIVASSLFDTVGVTDDFDGGATIEDDQIASVAKSIIEGIVSFEVISTVYTGFRTYTDTVLSTESSLFDTAKAVVESTGIVEALSSQFAKAMSETSIISESAISNFGKVVADTSVLSEAISSLIQPVLTDTLTTSESLVRNIQTTLFDFVVAIENVGTSSSTQGNYNTGDVAAITELLSSSVGKVASDTVSNIETLAFGYGRLVTDTTTIAETILRDYSPTSSLDTVTLVEAYASATGKSLTDSASSIEALVGDVSKVLLDSVTATDDFDGGATTEDDQIASVVKSIVDTVSISEYFAPFTPIFNSGDAASTTELLTKSIGSSILDAVASAESLTKTFSFALAEGSTITESLLKQASSVTNETATATESLSKSHSTLLFDTISVTDSLTPTFVAGGQNVSDGASITENITANMQDYFAEDYVSEDYVGTNITLL